MSFKFNLKKRAKDRFSVRMRSYKKEDRENAGKPDAEYVERTLPENEWARYGFTSKMTYKEASEHLKSLNAQSKDKEIKEKKARFKLVERDARKELLQSAYLSEALVLAFEQKLKNDSYSVSYEKSKTYYHWKTAMRVIVELELAPGEWAENKRTVLKKIEGYAPSTVAKILNLFNKYGIYYSKRMQQFYEPLTMPRGSEVGKISDKYLDKTGGKTKEAKGVTLEVMKVIKTNLDFSVEEKNWCIVALGFGLRPSEVDMIASNRDDSKFISFTSKTVTIYQPKLVSKPRPDRYKEVVIKHQFQKDAVKIVKSDSVLKKPLSKKIKRILGEEYGLYSLRKGYTDIMLGLNEDFARISSDLGHSSVDRTWKNYRKKITAKK